MCFVSLSLPLLCSSTVAVSLQAHQAKHIKPSRLRFGKEHFLFQSFINLGKDGNLNKKNCSLKDIKRCTLVPEHLTELVMCDRHNLIARLMKVFNCNALWMDYGSKMPLEIHWEWRTLAMDLIYNAIWGAMKNGAKNRWVDVSGCLIGLHKVWGWAETCVHAVRGQSLFIQQKHSPAIHICIAACSLWQKNHTQYEWTSWPRFSVHSPRSVLTPFWCITCCALWLQA